MTDRTTQAILVVLVLVWLYRVGAAPEPPAVQAAPVAPIAVVQQVAPAEPLAPVALAVPIGAKSVVTEAMSISADFYATGSPAWASQGGMHYGIDYNAPHGSPVFMPFDCAYTMTGYYDDPGRLGSYLMCHLMDGYEYYSGHLENVQPFAPGDVIPAGTLIGFTNEYDHSHIQLRDPAGNLVDFEAYYAAH